MENEGTFNEVHIEQCASEGFDYEQVFEDLDGHISESCREVEFQKLAASYRQNLNWIFLTEHGKQRKLPIAFKRFVCLTALLHPEIFQDKSYKQIGAEMGLGKAAVSKIALGIQDRFNIKFGRTRSKAGREAMSEAMRSNHWRKRTAQA